MPSCVCVCVCTFVTLCNREVFPVLHSFPRIYNFSDHVFVYIQNSLHFLLSGDTHKRFLIRLWQERTQSYTYVYWNANANRRTGRTYIYMKSEWEGERFRETRMAKIKRRTKIVLQFLARLCPRANEGSFGVGRGRPLNNTSCLWCLPCFGRGSASPRQRCFVDENRGQYNGLWFEGNGWGTPKSVKFVFVDLEFSDHVSAERWTSKTVMKFDVIHSIHMHTRF